MSQESWMDKMKSRWGLGPLGVLAVLAAFSLAGTSVLFIARPILAWVLPQNAPTYLKIVLYVVLIFPLYQMLLLAWGTLLGQFRFFWEREKELVRLLLRLVGGGKSRPEEES